jgi:hypothetical protein
MATGIVKATHSCNFSLFYSASIARFCGPICLHLNSSPSFVLFLPVLLCLFGLEFNNICENLSFILKCAHTTYFAVVFPLSDYKYLVEYTVYSSLFRLFQNSEVCHEALLTVWRRMFRRKEGIRQSDRNIPCYLSSCFRHKNLSIPAKMVGVQHTNKWGRKYERICSQSVDITLPNLRYNNANFNNTALKREYLFARLYDNPLQCHWANTKNMQTQLKYF